MSTFNFWSQADSIPTGTALSAGVNINNLDIVGLIMPAAGWDAAAITLQQSIDGATWFGVYDQNGNEVTLQAAASRYILLPPALLPGLGFVRLRSGTNAVPVNQTAARVLTWAIRNYGQ